MSPRRQVELTRWKAAVAFVAVTIAFIVSTAIATEATRKADRTANIARRISITNQHLIQRERQDRQARRVQSVATFILICRKQNQSNRILADLLVRIGKLPSRQPQAPAQARARAKLFRIFGLELRRLKPRTCGKLPVSKQP